MEIEVGVPGDSEKKRHRKSQKLLIKEMFLDFAKNTTLHGLRYITEVGLTVVEKVFWILTFLISVMLCFILIERVWHKWCYSPVIVSFNEKMVPVGDVPFPSITICPQWKCKKSAYNYTMHYKKQLESNTTGKIDDETYDEERILLENALLICDKFYQYLIPRNSTNKSLVDQLIHMAPTADEVIISSSWRGQMTFNISKHFTQVLTSEGVCLNFNALSYKDIFNTDSIQKEYKYLNSTTLLNKWNLASGYGSDTTATGGKVQEHSEEYPRRGQENGAQPDLDIVLHEDETDVDDSCNSMSNGWKVYLQHPTDMPQASLYYYGAIPGQVTSLALKFSILSTSENLYNYQPELRQCYYPKDRSLKYFATYTPDNCRLECLSLYTYEKCKCVWFHMPHNSSSEICTARSRKCVDEAKDELASNKRNLDKCNCLPSCDSVRYDAEILKTDFTTEKYNNSIKIIYNDSLPANRKYSRLEFYFKEPQFVSMRRSELFGLTDFLAACGGLLGLFLGFSFLSLIEIFYFGTLRLWCTLKQDNKNQQAKLKEDIDKK